MNNFQLFNGSLNNALTDSQYTNSQDRINGVLGELAKSTVHNKLFAQVSVAAYALAKFVSDHGQNALDRDPNGFSKNIELVILDLINGVVSDRVPNTRASSTAYTKGDVVDSLYIPKWGELECITAGTSANTDVINGVTINAIGQQINDGTVVWAIRAKRFKSLLNVPVAFSGNWTTPTLITEPSYPIHPEIGLPLWDYRLCDGTNGTIDMRNRFIMGVDKSQANQTGGNDNFSIKRENLPTDNFDISASASIWNGEVKQDVTTGKQSANHTHLISAYGKEAWAAVGWVGRDLSVQGRATESQTTSGISENHTHTFNLDLTQKVKHGHSVSGTVTLNSGTLKNISTVSQHYKMTYIQRIY